MKIVNWNPSNIFEARNKDVVCNNGTMTLYLDERGWGINYLDNNEENPTSKTWSHLDVWTACYILNEARAIFNQTEERG